MLQTVCLSIILVAFTVFIATAAVILPFIARDLIHTLIKEWREEREEDKGE